MSYHLQDTIAAIATAPGVGGIAVIRVSGKESIPILSKIFSKDVFTIPSHSVRYGSILDEKGSSLDEVLLLVMKSPRSFTGEDVVEIHCHGGSLISKRVLARVLQAGARTASPGEFSYRGFLNGKMDLTQAEAIQQLIAAKNELALVSAEKQLQGALSAKIRKFQEDLVDTAAILDAWVDFPEEGLEFASLEEIIEALSAVKKQMDHLLNTYGSGQKLHEGLSLCLCGLPNVGKSSLMNALLGKERAIVTDIAGTTRDLIEDELTLAGLHFKILDTAGIRETEEVIEKEGIRRSYQAISEADVILMLLDLSQEISEEEIELLKKLPPHKTLVVGNKQDLGEMISFTIPGFSSVAISAKTLSGMDDLLKAIENLVWEKGPPSKEEVMLTNLRHKTALENATFALNRLLEGLQTGTSPELLSSEMRYALRELSLIIGMDVTEDILNAVFSKFCVGK